MSTIDVRTARAAEGVGVLTWVCRVDEGDAESLTRALTEAVSAAAARALTDDGYRRLEVTVRSDDRAGRRAVLRSGFRQEGVLREAGPEVDERHVDLVTYARLDHDGVDGADGFTGVMNSALPRKRLIAHVLLRDAAGRILLCETQFKPDWELPGGIVEPGETPRTGAVREVAEELGVDLPVGRLLLVDWLPPYLGWEDAIELIFDGGLVDDAAIAAMTLQPTEIRSVRLCTLDEAAALVTPISHRRLALAATLGPGETAYTEDGWQD